MFSATKGGSPSGYQISRSVRLRSSASAYFNRTLGAGSAVTVYTFSAWVKRGELGTIKPIVQGYLNNNNYGHIIFKADNTIEWREVSVAANYGQVNTNAVFRDPSAWYHIVVVRNGTSLLIYVNGVSQTLTVSTAVNAAGGYLFGASTAQRIGSDQVNSAFFDGYLTECYLIDGQALTPSSFGSTNATTGVWQPIKYTGTYGTNGFYLNFSDNSAATAAAIGADYSGNGNDWTPNNISVTAGVTYDSMLDVPTLWADGGNGRGNYCTLNPIHYNNATVTESNLKHTSAGAGSVGRGTVAVSSGKWYYEFTLTSLGSVGSFLGGIIDSQQPNNTPTNLATVTGAMWLYRDDGYIANGGGSVNTGVTYTNNDVISVAFDVDGQKIWWAKNGTWLSSGNPAAGTNAQYTNVSSTANSFMPFVNEQAATSAGVFNFGQRPFAYTPPTGFKALNTLNLPEPTILKGNQYFDATTYTGNGTSQSVVNSGGMQPDFVWIKKRSAAGNNILFDALRGVNKYLISDSTIAEGTDVQTLTAFNSNGFSYGNEASGNANAATYVGWQWKEGATQGFDIVTYTGTGVARTVAHSLGVAPSMMIVKRRNTTSDWIVWHSAFAGTEYIALNSTAAKATGATIWNSTSPTSSVFSVGTSGATNGNTDTYVAYLFAEVAGFSTFGSYTGNGSADGPFVFLGFRPRFVLVKQSSSSGNNWVIYDTARDTYNECDSILYPNLSNAEFSGTTVNLDILSNGFKPRDNWGGNNQSGSTYIYAAFAENPFKNALAR
jgi:hypothetical protein